MKKQEKLQILFCGNDKMFVGLYLLIQSILRRTKSKIDFYFLTGDLTSLKPAYVPLTKKHESIISKLVKSYDSENSFNVIECGQKYLSKVKDNKIKMKLWTPYTLFRLLIGELPFKGKMLYLDIDMLVADDIKQAFDVDMTNTELCVCHDLPKADWNNGKYFNAGALLINVDYCKKTKLFQKAFKFCLDNDPEQLDQSALNYCWSNIKFWPNEYRFNRQPDNDIKDYVIRHFYGSGTMLKPWNFIRFKMRMRKEKNHIWDVDYRLFKEAKRYFN